MIAILDKKPYISHIRRFFDSTYGLVDCDETIECLCRGLSGTSKDYTHIRDLVYSDILFQGHHQFTTEQEFNMLAFFGAVKGKLIEELSEASNITRPELRIEFVDKYSPLSLAFHVWSTR